MVREEKKLLARRWHHGSVQPADPPLPFGLLRSQGQGSSLRSQLAPLDKIAPPPPQLIPHNAGTTTGSTHKVEGAEGLGVDTRVEAVAVVADLVDGLGRGDLVGLGLAGYRGAEEHGEVEARGNARGSGGGRDKGMEGLDGVGSWLVRAPDGAGDDGDVCGCRLADEEGGGRRIACAL
jgi:hypothetical protein